MWQESESILLQRNCHWKRLLKQMIKKKLAKGKCIEVIAEELEEDTAVIQKSIGEIEEE